MADYSSRIQNLTQQQKELLRRRSEVREGVNQSPTIPSAVDGRAARKLDFSIFFFSADGQSAGKSRYDLLLQSARYADRNGFKAVWTPERHFQAFGGLYPNPAVLSAALAMITQEIQLRAGSVVLPLHHPVRVAEDWAQVDVLSGGRVGISFATGWHEHDYVISPDAYEKRREIMFRDIETVRRLWAGRTTDLRGVGGKKVQVKTLPRPIQPELPFWITVSSTRTWRDAGAAGANVLTALLSGAWHELQQSIATYRQARAANGHNPDTGIVSLMAHTYVGSDLSAIRSLVREPMRRYLQSFLNQFRSMPGGSPPGSTVNDVESNEVTELLDFAFDRYFESSSLLGTPAKCLEIISKMQHAGVNEAACLIDFGLSNEQTLEGLRQLTALKDKMASASVASVEVS